MLSSKASGFRPELSLSLAISVRGQLLRVASKAHVPIAHTFILRFQCNNQFYHLSYVFMNVNYIGRLYLLSKDYHNSSGI